MTVVFAELLLPLRSCWLILPFIYSQSTNTTGVILVFMDILISHEFNKAYKYHVSIISLPLCSPVSVFHLNFYFSDPRDIIIHIFLSESQADLRTEPSLMRGKNTIKCLLKTFGKHIDMQLTVSCGCLVMYRPVLKINRQGNFETF